MPDHRKPPLHKSSRPDGAPMPSDTGGFSIESTTMRLKSLRLRRAEAVSPQIDEPAKPGSPRNPVAMPLETPRSGPSGRVRHDERGVAVWDWAVATGEFATLSTTRALKKLEVAELKIDDHKSSEFKLEVSGRDKAGGFDPYNQRGSGKRQGEAAQRAGITGAADRGSLLDRPPDKKK